MSNSLLTLLEIMDQVVREEELKEQASGGGHQMLDDIKNSIYDMSEKYIRIYLIDKIESELKKQKPQQLWTKDRQLAKDEEGEEILGIKKSVVYNILNRFKRNSVSKYAVLNQNYEEIVHNYFNINTTINAYPSEGAFRTQEFIVNYTPPGQQKTINIVRDSAGWDKLLKFAFADFHGAALQESKKNIIEKFPIFFNNALFLNIEKEHSYQLEDQLKQALITHSAIANISDNSKKGAHDIFASINLIGMYKKTSKKQVEKWKHSILSMLKHLSEGKAFYGVILIPPESIGKLEISPIYGDYYVIDSVLFAKMKEQCLSGSVGIFTKLHETAIKNYDFSPTSIDAILQKIVSTLQEVANEYYTKPQKLAKHPDVIPDIIYNLLYSTNEEIKKFGVTLKEKFSELRHEPKEAPTITNPLIDTSGGKLSSKFETVLDVFMEGATGLEERIDIFAQKMKIFNPDYEPTRGNNQEISNALQTMNSKDFFSRVMVLDYINKLTKQFDAGSAGILFEYFLAQLVGGEQVGQTGGAIDFRLGNKLGSAKMLSPSSQPVQSLENLQALENKEITYVVGRKRKSGLEPIRMLPTSNKKDKVKRKRKEQKTEKTEIFKIDLYVYTVQWIKDMTFRIAGTEKELTKEGTVVLLPHPEDIQDAYKGTIQIMSMSKEGIQSYREMLGKKLDATTDDLLKKKKDLLDIVQNIFDNLKEGDTNANKYILTGNLSDGVTAMTKLESAKSGLDQLRTYDEYSKDQNQPDNS